MFEFEIEIKESKEDKEIILQELSYQLSKRAEEKRIIDAAKEAENNLEEIECRIRKLSKKLWEVI